MVHLPIRDPGLQGERTALAWTRTALACGVNAALLMRSGWQHHADLVLGVGVVMGLASMFCAGLALLRRRDLAFQPLVLAQSSRLMGAAVVVVALAAVVKLIDIFRRLY